MRDDGTCTTAGSPSLLCAEHTPAQHGVSLKPDFVSPGCKHCASQALGILQRFRGSVSQGKALLFHSRRLRPEEYRDDTNMPTVDFPGRDEGRQVGRGVESSHGLLLEAWRPILSRYQRECNEN